MFNRVQRGLIHNGLFVRLFKTKIKSGKYNVLELVPRET